MITASNYQVDQIHPAEEQKHEEMVVVVHSDTVVDPLTVVVVSLNAFVADGTVNCATWFQYLAERTDEPLMEVLVQLQKRNLCRFLDKPWIFRGSETESQHF